MSEEVEWENDQSKQVQIVGGNILSYRILCVEVQMFNLQEINYDIVWWWWGSQLRADVRGSLNEDSHISERQRNMHTYHRLALSSYSGMLEGFSNCTLFKDLIKDIENFIQVKNYDMQYFFDWVKEDSYYLYPDQDSE